MEIKINLERGKPMDAERVLNYFYEKCLFAFELGEFERFEVKVESEEGKELIKGRKIEPKVILKEVEDEDQILAESS